MSSQSCPKCGGSGTWHYTKSSTSITKGETCYYCSGTGIQRDFEGAEDTSPFIPESEYQKGPGIKPGAPRLADLLPPGTLVPLLPECHTCHESAPKPECHTCHEPADFFCEYCAKDYCQEHCCHCLDENAQWVPAPAPGHKP